MSDKAFITPKVLRWARETARVKVEDAASSANVSSEKIIEWEEGKSQPTIRQAQNLAKKYKRPFALLFLPDIPWDFKPLQDFRKSGSRQLTTSSVFIIREIQQKQAWISEMFAEEEYSKLPFVGRFNLSDNPEMVASDILKTLDIHPSRYKTDNPIREWIESAERIGIFVSRTSFIHPGLKIEKEELQGFAIADPFAPFVFVNSDDWAAPQLFTLVHELAHIWIAASGISNEVNTDKTDRNKYDPVELFCNKVAANALMPTSLLSRYDNTTFQTGDQVFKTAKLFGVSSFALLIRLREMNLLSEPTYRILRKDADYAFEQHLSREAEKKEKQKLKQGGPDPYLLKLNRNSRLFTQTVLDAYRGGIIEPTLASNLLDVQVNKFQKLEAHLYA